MSDLPHVVERVSDNLWRTDVVIFDTGDYVSRARLMRPGETDTQKISWSTHESFSQRTVDTFMNLHSQRFIQEVTIWQDGMDSRSVQHLGDAPHILHGLVGQEDTVRTCMGYYGTLRLISWQRSDTLADDVHTKLSTMVDADLHEMQYQSKGVVMPPDLVGRTGSFIVRRGIDSAFERFRAIDRDERLPTSPLLAQRGTLE